MPVVDFDKLFLQADNLRNNGITDEAILSYIDIANLAKDAKRFDLCARATYLAGVSAKASVKSLDDTYYHKAMEYLRAASEMFTSLGKNHAVGSIYRDMGVVCDNGGNFQDALLYFQQALAIFNKLGEEANADIGITMSKLGGHFLKVGEVETAEKFSEKAIGYLRKSVNPGFFLATALYDRARILTAAKRDHDAIDLAEESLSWFVADHDNEEYGRRIAQIEGLLSLLYKRSGHARKADEYSKRYSNAIKRIDPVSAQVISLELARLSR